MIRFISLPEFGLLRLLYSERESCDYKFDPKKTPQLKLGLPYAYLSAVPRVRVGDEYFIKCHDSEDGFHLQSIYTKVVKKEEGDFKENVLEERGDVKINGEECSFKRRISRAENLKEVNENGIPHQLITGGFECITKVGEARERVEGEYEFMKGVYHFCAKLKGKGVEESAKRALYVHMHPSRRWIPELNLSKYDVEFSGFCRELSHPSSKTGVEEWWIFQLGEDAEKLRALEITCSGFGKEREEVVVKYRSMKDELARSLAQLV